MADRVKRSWRGQSYTAKSRRPGKKRVTVRPYCRRKPKTFAARYHSSRDMPF